MNVLITFGLRLALLLDIITFDMIFNVNDSLIKVLLKTDTNLVRLISKQEKIHETNQNCQRGRCYDLKSLKNNKIMTDQITDEKRN